MCEPGCHRQEKPLRVVPPACFEAKMLRQSRAEAERHARAELQAKLKAKMRDLRAHRELKGHVKHLEVI